MKSANLLLFVLRELKKTNVRNQVKNFVTLASEQQ
jgi:hypothetical protein